MPARLWVTVVPLLFLGAQPSQSQPTRAPAATPAPRGELSQPNSPKPDALRPPALTVSGSDQLLRPVASTETNIPLTKPDQRVSESGRGTLSGALSGSPQGQPPRPANEGNKPSPF
jgi:hypothetical protein